MAEFKGKDTVKITLPVTCAGLGGDFTFAMVVYEGSSLPGHGRVLASYQQDAHFNQNERKSIVFTHQCEQTTEARRDVGLVVYISSEEVGSEEWDDLFTVTPKEGEPGILETVMMLMMVMMLTQITDVMGEKGD